MLRCSVCDKAAGFECRVAVPIKDRKNEVGRWLYSGKAFCPDHRKTHKAADELDAEARDWITQRLAPILPDFDRAYLEWKHI